MQLDIPNLYSWTSIRNCIPGLRSGNANEDRYILTNYAICCIALTSLQQFSGYLTNLPIEVIFVISTDGMVQDIKEKEKKIYNIKTLENLVLIFYSQTIVSLFNIAFSM